MSHPDERHLNTIAARARVLMDELNLDALVASSYENFYYLCGHESTFMYTLRMNEVALAVLFRDPSTKTIIIMNDFEAAGVSSDLPNCELRTYPTWVDVDDPLGLRGGKYEGKRPTGHQAQEMFGLLQRTLAEYGCQAGRIAVELNNMRHSSVETLQQAAPEAELVEAQGLFTALRMIKTTWEIEQLRAACAYAEAGITDAVQSIRQGSTAEDIVHEFRRSLMKDVKGLSARFHMISVGASFAPAHRFDTYPARTGDVIKFDVGVDVNGYGSDIARTFVLGNPSETITRIYGALKAGHDRLLEIIAPGISMQAAFEDAMAVIRRSGLPNYNRGHLGHSAGLSLAAEEPPFLGPSETTLFQPGMVICLETPYYGYGIGAMMIEDMVLVTTNGCERMNRLSRELVFL
ncbi:MULTISPECIES: M24 family metallopeptidase [Paenibacillus]|uniref:M24 family metallopeptidase n=1 Tax=Paenibacillus violae TaxID=3077234 RepID=A0ABU3RK16_9BACL|nr:MULTISPECIES: M24 family metallopeptidase [Paenibacillus]MDU0204634.1 M24 family metallopeptidase [Paenibacillus sp. PFR10]MEC0266377.1 M24 family metallopeptidase [Paenibacillus anseongense]